MADENESRSSTPRKAIVETRPKEADVVEVVDRNVGRAIGVFEERQKLSHEQAVRRLGIDRGILLVFAISLLASLAVMFYLIMNDRLTAVNTVLYPLISLVIGFMSGYFAGSGRGGRRG
jgi:hypothetical protein